MDGLSHQNPALGEEIKIGHILKTNGKRILLACKAVTIITQLIHVSLYIVGRGIVGNVNVGCIVQISEVGNLVAVTIIIKAYGQEPWVSRLVSSMT